MKRKKKLSETIDFIRNNNMTTLLAGEVLAYTGVIKVPFSKIYNAFRTTDTVLLVLNLTAAMAEENQQEMDAVTFRMNAPVIDLDKEELL